MRPSSPRTLTSLYAPDYRLLWIGVALTHSGRWSLLLALSWLVQTLTGSTFWVGMVVFAQMAPSLMIAPIVGVLADRFDRRHLMAFALAANAAAALLLALHRYLDMTALWPIILLTFSFGASSTLMRTAANALVPNLVPREHLLNAMALQGTAVYGSELAGPLIASPVLVVAGPGAVFLLCALLNTLAVLATLRIRPLYPAPLATGAQTLMGPLRDGLQYIKEQPRLGLLIGMVTLHCGLTMSYMGLLPSLVITSHAGGSAGYGSLMTAIGLGAVVGSLSLTSVTQQRLRGLLYLGSSILSGLSLAWIAASPNLTVALTGAFAIGLSQTAFMTLSLTLIQELVDDHFRGRVTSLFNMVAVGFMALCSWTYGALGDLIGPAVILSAVGLSFVIATVIVWNGSARLRLITGAMAQAGGE